MTDRETTRLVAWSNELRRVHRTLRELLASTQEAIESGGEATDATRELLLYCHGFCTALDRHHRGEDRALFPAIEDAHPELAPVLRALEEDHEMIAHLLSELAGALARSGTVAEIAMHLDGIEAVMETHFDYEERQLLAVLEGLALDVPIREALDIA